MNRTHATTSATISATTTTSPHRAGGTPLRRAALLAATALPMLALPAQAAPEDGTLGRVEVSGARHADTPRTDVRTVCPMVDDTVARRMAALVHQIREEGVTTVHFRLQGRQVLSTQATGGPRAYRSQLRRAVGSLECQGEPHVNQAYVMEVSFRQDASEGGMRQLVQIRPMDGAQLASAAATR